MDDPQLVERGRSLIKQYGCAGCHEIKGFEEEQRIGKELTVEGATPIERLDFALLTHDAEYGKKVLKDKDGKLLDLHPDKKDKNWYNHSGFFEHKLAEPAIYDHGKRKGSERASAHARAASAGAMAHEPDNFLAWQSWHRRRERAEVAFL